MTTHELKILETYADAVLMGDKTFEVRDNSDRGFQKGDIVHFKSVDKLGIRIYHEIDYKEYIITYVLSGGGIKEGWVVFGIKEHLNLQLCEEAK